MVDNIQELLLSRNESTRSGKDFIALLKIMK
jgi:hypothetical protein